MAVSMRKNHPILKMMNGALVDLPSPSSISYLWNFGSLLGMTLAAQIMTGVFLSMHFTADVNLSFDSVIHILRDVNCGWLMRTLHLNGASMFFILIYSHTARGLYFSSYKSNSMVWLTGVVILLILMGTAFLGYVLPWGQMSFWGATVITNMVSAVPYIGTVVVEWLWGGFSVGNATLTRFFALHYLLPFILTGMIMVHLIFLHQEGSSSPSGMFPSWEKTSFHPHYSYKDLMGAALCIMALSWLTLETPYAMGDPENFTTANPLSTPVHIQPEWYFLFAYAILRSIPNKLGGVAAMIASIAILMLLVGSKTKTMSSKFSPSKKMNFWSTVALFTVLTWIGANPVEAPYEEIGRLTSVLYFLSMLGFM